VSKTCRHFCGDQNVGDPGNTSMKHEQVYREYVCLKLVTHFFPKPNSLPRLACEEIRLREKFTVHWA